MEPQFPVLLASDLTVAEQIRSWLCENSGKNVAVCQYDECQDSFAWYASGAVVLVVDSDTEYAAANFIEEAQLRCSQIQLAVVHIGDADQSGTFNCCSGIWPNQMGAVAELLRATPASSGRKKPLADIIADRLRWQTPSLLPQVNRLALAAAHDVTVLLTGETGTGKTYLARLLHEHSPRRNHPFLMVPCGAQPTNLFESTFFGHVKGAYTGAHQTHVGRFAAAGKGTILLDEIDALGLEQQASLLRVIETGEYESVGGNETQRSEARIIVASNADLSKEIENDKFRQDLFYRLNVLSFHLLPLRQRRQDIPLLARGIVARLKPKFKKCITHIAVEALDTLAAYDWPGNIRQLENVLQEAVLTCNGTELTRHDLPYLLPAAAETESASQASADLTQVHFGHSGGEIHSSIPSDTLIVGRLAYERGVIQRTLAGCKFNRSRAARVLGVSRVTLYKKMKQYGLTDLPVR